MNYDLLTWIEYFIGAFACCFGMFLTGKILLERSFKEIKWYSYPILLVLTIFIVFNALTFDNIVKILGNLVVFFIIFKFIFKEESIKCFTYSLICYIIFPISEILFVFSVSLLDYIFKLSIAATITKAIYANIIISILSCSLTFILRDKLMNLVQKITKTNVFILFLQGTLTVFVLLSSLNNLYMEDWKFSYKLVLNTVIIFGSAILTFALLRQYLKNKEVVEKHQLLEEYLKTSASLVEKYSSTLHKYKNNLIAIKGYIKSDSNEANKYIDNLLDTFQDRKYSWFSKLNYISIDTLRYLIYYKLSKSEELNLKISVNVSKDIKNIPGDSLNLRELSHVLDIIGELFDNANYASNESDLKELNLDLYLENNKLIFVISNTYKEEVDLSLITKNGYTTKGKSHGLGLYDIEKTINNLAFLDNTYELVDNYFIVTFAIDLEKLSK